MRYVVILPLLLLVIGCTVSYQASDLKGLASPASTQVNHVKKSNFCIAAHELNDREAETYLGLNVREEGYIPYIVDFENRSDTGFIVKPNMVKIITEKGDELDPVPVREVIEACKYSHWRVLPCWIIIIPGIFIAIDSHQSISLANELMEKDYLAKSFKKDGYLVNPQQMDSGLLFFKTPAPDNPYSHLLLRVKQLGETEEKFIELIEFKISLSGQ